MCPGCVILIYVYTFVYTVSQMPDLSDRNAQTIGSTQSYKSFTGTMGPNMTMPLCPDVHEDMDFFVHGDMQDIIPTKGD